MWEDLSAWKWIGALSVVLVVITLGLRAVTQRMLQDTLHPVDGDEGDGDGS